MLSSPASYELQESVESARRQSRRSHRSQSTMVQVPSFGSKVAERTGRQRHLWMPAGVVVYQAACPDRPPPSSPFAGVAAPAGVVFDPRGDLSTDWFGGMVPQAHELGISVLP